jgi:hypothetical protein
MTGTKASILVDPVIGAIRVSPGADALGYLGEFRRSRLTGPWFAGRRALHMAGD